MPDITTAIFTTASRLGPFAEAALAQVAGPAGGGGGPAAPAPAGGSSSPAPSSGGSSGMVQLLFPVLIFVAFYFFLIRPQQKKAKELAEKLKKGDRVFTNSGIIGKIMVLGEKRVTLEIAPNVKIEVLRSAIGGLDEGDDAKGAKDDKAEKIAEAKK
ncbi:MAG: preprotein translocase subunit YajC [Polyangiales bacterium]